MNDGPIEAVDPLEDFDAYVEYLNQFYEQMKKSGIILDYEVKVDRMKLDINTSVHLHRPIKHIKIDITERTDSDKVNLLEECEE